MVSRLKVRQISLLSAQVLFDDRADLLVLAKARGDESGRRMPGCQQACVLPLSAGIDKRRLDSFAHVSRPDIVDLVSARGTRQQAMRRASILCVGEAVR